MNRVSVIVIYISMLAMCAFSIVYANYSVKESGRNFCDIITTVNDAYAEEQPVTDLGRKLKQNYIDLEKRLECER